MRSASRGGKAIVSISAHARARSSSSSAGPPLKTRCSQHCVHTRRQSEQLAGNRSGLAILEDRQQRAAQQRRHSSAGAALTRVLFHGADGSPAKS